MIHSETNFKANHTYTYMLIDLLNQPAQLNQQEGFNFKTFI